MYKSLLLLLFVLLSDCRMAFSQQEFRADSLIAVLQSSSDWEARRSTLDALAWDVYLYFKPDSSLFYARQLESESRTNGDLSSLANALSVQGVAQKTMGNFSRALKHLEACLEVYQNMVSSSDSLTSLKGLGGLASTRGNMGNIFRLMGDYERALNSYAFTIETTKEIQKRLGAKSGRRQLLSLANSHINRGAVFIYQKKWDEAQTANSLALELFIQIGDVDAQSSAYRNLGMIAESRGDFMLAMNYYRKCMDMRKDKSDPAEKASILNSLAVLYFKLGDNNKSLEYNLLSKAYAEQVGNKIGIRDACDGLYTVYRVNGNIDSAWYYLNKAIQINDGIIENNFPILSEKEKEKLLSMVLPEYASLYSFTLAHASSKPELCGEVYSTVVRNKGMLLRSSASLMRLVKTSGDTILTRLYAEWMDQRRAVADAFNGNRKDSVSIENANRLEREMVKRSASIGAYQAETRIDWKAIQASLKKNEAAVEFVRFHDEFQHETIHQYIALILRPGMDFPTLIPICNEDQLKRLLKTQSNTTLSGVNQLYGTKSEYRNAIYQLIWSPLETQLKGVNVVYYSPDGLLNKISFAAIRDQKGKYLSDKFQLYPVLNTAVLASKRESSFSPKKVELFGGIDYSYPQAPEVWKYLPGTEEESGKISELLVKEGIPHSQLRGKEATEAAFRQRSFFAPIVHIASHGYFFPDPLEISDRSEVDTLFIGEMRFRSGASEGRNRFVINPDPMMRSGLVFSGANRVWMEQEEVAADEDGVLTAYEISGMDLSSVNLITLSACETGLGDLHSTEGVFGLQRAFKMAGVQFLIMSLWQVPDQETAEFMLLFYEKLLRSKNIRMAFHQAQHIMSRRHDPYYWAAFVLVE